MTVDLFVPCYINHLTPKTAWSVIKILENNGLKVNYDPSHACCGQPTFNSGYWDRSTRFAEKFTIGFDNDRPIIIPSASCAGFIKNHYTRMLKGNDELSQRFDNIKKNIFELTDFLVNRLKVTCTGATFPKKVTYHDGCSALREYGLKEEPRLLLGNVKGLTLVEMADTTTCCGFGGTFMISFPGISSAMAEQKIYNALATGAEYIASSEASCLVNLESYISKNKIPLKTIHVAEILANGL